LPGESITPSSGFPFLVTMKTTFKFSYFLLVLSLLCAGHVRASLLSDEEARQGVADLKSQQTVLSRQQQTMDERVTRMETALQGYPDLVMRLDSMSQDLAQIRGRIDSLANQLDVEDKRFHDLYMDLDSRLKAVETVLPKPEGAGSISGSPGVANGKEGAVPSAGTAESGKNSLAVADNGSKPENASDAKTPSADYDAALSVFNAGNYVKSRKLFEAFVKSNPDDDKVPNALYWIGMNQLLLKDYKGARATNQHLYKSFPDSAKTPDGLLNLAAAWLGLGEPATAKATWKMIIAKYPDSSAAQKAKARLRQH